MSSSGLGRGAVGAVMLQAVRFPIREQTFGSCANGWPMTGNGRSLPVMFTKRAGQVRYK